MFDLIATLETIKMQMKLFNNKFFFCFVIMREQLFEGNKKKLCNMLKNNSVLVEISQQ